MVLAYSEHLNLAPILRTSSLEYFVIVKEQVYPEQVEYFNSKLSFIDNQIQSRFKNIDINISLERFARIFQLSCEGADIFHFGLHDFDYPANETALTASLLLHDDDFLGLVRNEEVKYYTLTA